jgi:DNA polymerase-3 subunit delta'
MSWHGIHGHDDVVEGFRRRIQNGRLASTFLFVGLPGIGKRTFALKLAQALLCERSTAAALDPCEACPSCQQVLAGTHPDVTLVEREKSKARVTIEQLVGPDDKRMQEGLVHAISLKPYYGQRKVGIIDDADTLSHGQGESANCLLKTLEEPPPHSLLILIGTSELRQLPTIRSRAQVIRFQPLADAIVAQLLVEKNIVEDPRTASQLAELAHGSLQTAQDFAEPEVREFRTRWLRFLADAQPEAAAFSKPLASFVDEAGKDAPSRRARLRLLAAVAVDYFRELIRALHGEDATGDEALRQAVDAGVRHWNLELEVAADSLERCLDAIAQIDANANQATLIDAWLDDLAQLRLVGHL